MSAHVQKCYKKYIYKYTNRESLVHNHEPPTKAFGHNIILSMHCFFYSQIETVFDSLDGGCNDTMTSFMTNSTCRFA